MNKHLKNAETGTEAPARAGPAPSRFGTSHRHSRKPWVNWLLVAGLLFGAYIYLGHNFLRPEFTWAQIAGTVSGQTVAAATKAATAAEAAKAAAVAASTVAAETPLKAQQAADVARATFPVQVALAASQAEAAATAEIVPKLQLATGTADIDVEKQRRIIELELERSTKEATIKADGERQRIQAINYDECMANAARVSAQAMGSATGTGRGTGGDSIAAGITAAAMAQSSCEEFRQARDDAAASAEKIKESLKRQ